MSELFGGGDGKREGEREGLLSVVPFLLSSAPSLPPFPSSSCLPRWGACKHLGWSSVRPSSRCRSGRRKEGRKGASLCFAFAPSLPCLCPSPTYFILTLSLSVSTLRSFPSTDSLFAIELAKKKINAAASTADRASTFYSGGHWLPLPPPCLPSVYRPSALYIGPGDGGGDNKNQSRLEKGRKGEGEERGREEREGDTSIAASISPTRLSVRSDLTHRRCHHRRVLGRSSK